MQWPLEMFRRHQCWALVKSALTLGVVTALAVTSQGCASRGTPADPPTEPPVEEEVTTPSGPAWLTRTAEPDFVPLSDPAGGVSIEYPKEHWQSVPGSSPTVATFTQEAGEATVVLSQTQLNQALQPEEVTDVFGQIEAETIKEREPNASDFDTRLLEDGSRRVVAIQYQRPGSQGPEVVRQYSFPVAQTLYRLTCVMKPDKLQEQEPICAHMAASFTVPGS
ncbi:MAG: hypothetical protein GEV06_13795 [Luteitalea sp.]|nr:hypothetical protein [Luteitalea sp.]